MSNVFPYILFIVAVIILTVVLQLLELPKSLIYIIIFGLYLSVFIIRPGYLIYKSKSLPAIERYVAKNHKKPLFGYAYALAHGNSRDIEGSLKRILQKYKQAEVQTIYGANLALHYKDSDTLIQQAEKMNRKDFKEYYLGVAYLFNGDIELSKKYLAQLTTPWMIHSLKASIALHHKDKEAFQSEAEQSIDSSTGLQRYTLHYLMRRMEKESQLE